MILGKRGRPPLDRRILGGRLQEAAHVRTRLGDTRSKDIATVAGNRNVVPSDSERLEQVGFVILDQVGERPVAGNVRIPPGEQ